MANIKTYSYIDDTDISPFVLSVKSDVKTGGDSNVQQLDLTIANPAGRFDGLWSTQSMVFVVLISKEWITDTIYNAHTSLIFTGRCQKIEYNYLDVKVRAGCDLKQASSSCLWNIHKHGGQTADPIIQAILEMWGLKEGVIDLSTIPKREWFFLGTLDGLSVLDAAAMHEGKEVYIDEANRLNFRTVESHGDFPILTGRMRSPASSQSAVGWCNRVCCRGGSWLPAADVGAEQNANYPIGYETTDEDLAVVLGPPGTPNPTKAADLMAKYGVIRAPDFVYPELTTEDECKKRAINLLRLYTANLNVAMPAVIGRSPQIRDQVYWQFRRLYGEKGWLPTELQSGSVSRRIDEVSARQGYVSYCEVQPNLLRGEADPDDPYTVRKTCYDRADRAIYKGSDGTDYAREDDHWIQVWRTGFGATGVIGHVLVDRFLGWVLGPTATPPPDVQNLYDEYGTTCKNPNPDLVIEI